MYFTNFEEFEIYFWQYIPDNVVSATDININNIDFCKSVCFSCFRMYEKGDLSLDIICKLAEDMLYNVKRYKPFLGE